MVALRIAQRLVFGSSQKRLRNIVLRQLSSWQSSWYRPKQV